MINNKPSGLGIASLATLLEQVKFHLDGEELADLLWLGLQMGEVSVGSSQAEPVTLTPENKKDEHESVDNNSQTTNLPSEINQSEPSVPAYVDNSSKQIEEQTKSKGTPFNAPKAPGLRKRRELARALRPLMRKVPSKTNMILDEEETVNQTCEQRTWTTVLKPRRERWLDLALVVEESNSTRIWEGIIKEFQKLTELQGAFRYTRAWSLKTDAQEEIKLFSQQNNSTEQRPRSPKELLDPTGRRLILLISDCTSCIWRKGQIHQFLKTWSNYNPLAIVQLLPERLWNKTVMGYGFPVTLSASVPGVPNKKLLVDGLPVWEEINLANSITSPVITLEPNYLLKWSRMLAGIASTQTAGILFEESWINCLPEESTENNQLTSEELVQRFRVTASPTARRLAGLMALVPVSLPVVYLIQKTLLKESLQVHVAEVFMSGLLKPITSENTTNKGETVQYDFIEGVRELLVDSVPTPDVDEVLEKVSQYIAEKVGVSIEDFTALLSPNDDWDEETRENILPFARITETVLRRLGGEYAALADTLKSTTNEQESPEKLDDFKDFPSITNFEFKIRTISFQEDETSIEIPPEINLQPFTFESATIELKKSGIFANTEIIIHRHPQQSQYFIEDLGNGIELEMVLIPGGTFTMGAPENEKGSDNSERPQHQVTVPTFFMGRYQITQAQWRVVANLPQVERELKSEPSLFQGDNLPVEKISWYDAVEFCARLSNHTRREYRLPSEAEWEYACRAGTATPFHFGETITGDLANYRATNTFIDEPKGEYRGKTTPVGQFPPNHFGLYDMHGNVWEWCLDDWHDNYKGAPINGSAWVDSQNKNDNFSRKVMRGGSWDYLPVFCRSAFRNNLDSNPNFDDNLMTLGLRVVCSVTT